MIACAQCKTTNTLDSRFCRRCGGELSADILTEARAELDALVQKGTEAFEAGRIDDAMAIAEEAVHTDPAHANAHALKGMAHERRGEVAKALEAYERVCELNPDSALDRLKLSGLRAALAQRATATPDRRTPLLAGASAAVLLACVGIAAAKMAGGSKDVAPTATNSAINTGLVAQAESSRSDVSPVANGRVTPQTNTVLGPNDVLPAGSENAPAADGTISGSTATGRGALPRARNDSPSRGISGPMPDLEIVPMNPGQIGTGLPNPNGVPTQPTLPRERMTRTQDPMPQPQDPTPGERTTSAPPRSQPKPKNDGLIDIKVESGSGNSGGSGEASANGAEALSRVGKAHAQGGDFDRAARAYERALAAGADPAPTNQRLGQAYERMGKKAEAKAAYERSADGYRRKIASGKASDRDKNGLDSVNQAKKVLDRG